MRNLNSGNRTLTENYISGLGLAYGRALNSNWVGLFPIDQHALVLATFASRPEKFSKLFKVSVRANFAHFCLINKNMHTRNAVSLQ